jgi:hypothetical protein
MLFGAATGFYRRYARDGQRCGRAIPKVPLPACWRARERAELAGDLPASTNLHQLQYLPARRGSSLSGTLFRHEVERDLRQRAVLFDANVVEPLSKPLATGEDRLAKAFVLAQVGWIVRCRRFFNIRKRDFLVQQQSAEASLIVFRNETRIACQ